MKTATMALLAVSALTFSTAAQQGPRHFDWVPANNETVRLDPAYYHAGRTYHPASGGGNLHVDIQAQQPVTVLMVSAAEWNSVVQHPEYMDRLQPICMNEHVSHTIYECRIPGEPMTLVIRDERPSPEPAILAGLGVVVDSDNQTARAVGTGISAVIATAHAAAQNKRTFKSPNDVHIQYFAWNCVANCVQPEFQWIDQAKEKYKLTTFPKIYSGFTPQYDGQQISVKIDSPVPMAVALLPSDVANQVYSNPQAFESALQKDSCQQRGIQKLQFQCTFNAADGPQSLVAVPEQRTRVPNKKAYIEWLIDQCTENCNLLSSPELEQSAPEQSQQSSQSR